MIKPVEVFKCCSDAVNTACRRQFGPPSNVGNEQLTASIAVALLQLSFRYFIETKAPKQVVFDFFLETMGIEKEKFKLKEIEGGKLVIVPASPIYVS